MHFESFGFSACHCCWFFSSWRGLIFEIVLQILFLFHWFPLPKKFVTYFLCNQVSRLRKTPLKLFLSSQHSKKGYWPNRSEISPSWKLYFYFVHSLSTFLPHWIILGNFLTCIKQNPDNCNWISPTKEKSKDQFKSASHTDCNLICWPAPVSGDFLIKRKILLRSGP